jgi:hypothetical protein
MYVRSYYTSVISKLQEVMANIKSRFQLFENVYLSLKKYLWRVNLFHGSVV